VHRITIPNTVEDRILALQEQKQIMINQAMGEGGAGIRNMRLGLQDLIHLFGRNDDDEE
jgi:SNF2 family DNA or RNA helicase